MLHQPLLFVAAIQHAQLREDALMRPVQVDALLEQLHDRCKVTTDLHTSAVSIACHSTETEDSSWYFVVVDEVVEVIHEDDDMNTASLREAELLSVDAGVAHRLPGRDGVGLASSVHRLLELVQVYIAERKLAVVIDVLVQDARSLIETLHNNVNTRQKWLVTLMLQIRRADRTKRFHRVHWLCGDFKRKIDARKT